MAWRSFRLFVIKLLGLHQLPTTNMHSYAGLGYSYGAVTGGSFAYAHADIRYDFTFKEKVTPFADLRVSFNKESVIVQPAIGYRYKHINSRPIIS